MRALPPIIASLALGVAGCGSSPAAGPELPPDAGPVMDASVADAGQLDAGPPEPTEPTDETILEARWALMANAPRISGKQDDIFFLTPQLGWAVNGLGNIYKTTDGGENWSLQLHQEGTHFRAVLFISPQRGFVTNVGTGYYPNVTDPVPMYETRDGGETWMAVTSISGPMPKGICNFTQLSDEHIVAVGRVGGPSFVLISTDRGESWTSSEVTPQIPVLIDGHFFNPQEGVLLGGTQRNPSLSQSLVLRTSDGGATWQEVFRSEAFSELGWKLSFVNDRVGYASVLASHDNSSFLKTTDGGQTWQQLPMNVGAYQAKGIGFINERIGWIGGELPAKPAYRTSDGGETWQPAPDLGPLINRIRFVDPWTAYAIGSTVYKLELPHP